MRKQLLVALASVSLVVFAGSGIAQAEPGVRFGIRPTQAFVDRPESFSYFSHQLAPGAVLDDAALVINSGEVAVSLKLYAADGITAVNAGTAFAKRGKTSTGASLGTSQWLSFTVTEFALAPGQEIVVPFTITVPADATPGHHVAGLVVEAPPGEQEVTGVNGDESSGQFAAVVVQQAAVAVVIYVAGPHVAGLEITGTCLKIQTELGATFEVAVRNTGNIIVKGEGSHLIMDRNGEELTSAPLKLGAVLPGDETYFQFTHPAHLADGSYLVNAALNYEGEAAVLDGVEFKVKDGQPTVGCHPEEEEQAAPPLSITDIVPFAPSPGGAGLLWYAGAGFLALALALLLFVLLRRARRRRAQHLDRTVAYTHRR